MRTITPEFENGVNYANFLNEARITRNYEPVYQPEELDIIRLGLDPDPLSECGLDGFTIKGGSVATSGKSEYEWWWKYCTLFCIFQLFGRTGYV